jgi:hypothetical protein
VEYVWLILSLIYVGGAIHVTRSYSGWSAGIILDSRNILTSTLGWVSGFCALTDVKGSDDSVDKHEPSIGNSLDLKNVMLP